MLSLCLNCLFSYSISRVSVCCQDNSLYIASLDCSRRTKSVCLLIFNKLHLLFDLFLKRVVQDFVPFLVPNEVHGTQFKLFLRNCMLSKWGTHTFPLSFLATLMPQRHLKCLCPLIPDLAPFQYALH